MSEDRRLHARLPMRGVLDCKASFSYAGRDYLDIPVISLSAGGMFIPLNRRDLNGIAKGGVLESIALSLAPIDVFRARGLIAYVLPMGDAGIGGCGVRFTGLSDDEVNTLDGFVLGKLQELGV